MKTSLKILGISALALALVLPMLGSLVAADNPSPTNQYEDRNRYVIQVREHPKLLVLKHLLAHSTAVTINGTIVTHARNILIVDSSGTTLGVILPPAWNVDSEVMGVWKLFNQSYVANGDGVTIKALKDAYTNDQGVTISIIFGYEIVDNTNGNHLYAVLPFNIEG